jgi:LuxR family transcriptional regulator, maltose regulon positive regulatory protein
VLVLDDVHELTQPRVLHGIELLVRHAPPQLRLVLSTRADPPLPLHRLLVSGQLTQIRGADLAFTVPEVDELLAGYDYRSRLADDDLAGDDRSLAGYLVAEVLERQPAELRSFLLRTCVVDELSGGLADALTGRDDGEWTLARLERANVFVVAVGSRREWYRYHPLFAELLRHELRREAPHEVTGLRRRAASWYADQGLPVEALQQATAVRDWGHAADLIVEHGFGRALHGQDRAFRDLLDRLPADAARLDPELALLTAAERIAAADDDAEASLQVARSRSPSWPTTGAPGSPCCWRSAGCSGRAGPATSARC